MKTPPISNYPIVLLLYGDEESFPNEIEREKKCAKGGHQSNWLAGHSNGHPKQTIIGLALSCQ